MRLHRPHIVNGVHINRFMEMNEVGMDVRVEMKKVETRMG